MKIINLNVANPGHFYAACGLFELAAQRDAKMRGHFAGGCFTIDRGDLRAALEDLISADVEGGVEIRDPVIISQHRMRIDWYSHENLSPLRVTSKLPARLEPIEFRTPAVLRKSMWGGHQRPHKTFVELCAILRGKPINADIFALRVGTSTKFGVDPACAWNQLDLGYSPNLHGTDVLVSPAVELLAFVGLQRFRPTAIGRSFYYRVWEESLPLLVARSAAAHQLPFVPCREYAFEILPRGKIHSFSMASPSKQPNNQP